MEARGPARVLEEYSLSDILSNALLLVVLLAGTGLGWVVARGTVRARIERAVAHSKARTVFNYQREIQRLRQANIDQENQVKGLTERLERREQVMRGTQAAEMATLREDLRLAKEEIARLQASGAAIASPPVSAALRPSEFQDLVANPQAKARPPRRSA
jgi:hypothetical protein